MKDFEFLEKGLINFYFLKSGRAHIFIKRATLKLLTSKRKNDKFIVNNYEALLTNINANVSFLIKKISKSGKKAKKSFSIKQ